MGTYYAAIIVSWVHQDEVPPRLAAAIMNYLLTPLEDHFDRGFGAVADSFKSAADQILEGLGTSRMLDEHMPAAFLYRHAAELYLKSAIIIFHRYFNLPYGTSPSSSEPQVKVGARWKSMYQVHSLVHLFGYWHTLLNGHQSELAATTRTDWSLPETLPLLVAEVEDLDPLSTFFRYPVSGRPDRDAEKSLNRADSYGDIMARMGPGEPYVKALVVLGEDGEVRRAYQYDDTKAAAMVAKVQALAGLLWSLHAAMRGELTGGW